MSVVRDYLGHADSRTTEKYAKLHVEAQRQIFGKNNVKKFQQKGKLSPNCPQSNKS
ncbi:MAG: hypothetical protein HQK92_12640 [Nitrospirae bacterium]|nr:hypothetical protein [Nitrospirota bacterium]